MLAGAHVCRDAADECGPTMVRHQLSPTQAVHVACNWQEQHCFEKKRRAKTVVGEQLDPPLVGSSLVRTPGVTVVHTGSNRKGTAHIIPRGVKKHLLWMHVAAAGMWAQARHTQRSSAQQLPPNGYTAGGSVQICIIHTNDFSLYTGATNKTGVPHSTPKYLSVHART